jgi:hypothetical protein
MTTNVKVFKSTDAGAPVLNGTVGTLLAVLDAVLIDGINAGSVPSITRSGSTATATRAGHGFLVGDCILNAGADQPEYNGEFYITAVTTDTYQFTVAGTPATPATGTLTSKKAPGGWTKPFSGTNKAVYRQGGGNQHYLRVVDDGTGNATCARAVGYESMTDVDTGTAAFPTAAQFSGGVYWSKSTGPDATARPWTILVTDRTLLLMVNPNSLANGGSGFGGFFGHFKSFGQGDAFNTLLLGGTALSAGSNNMFANAGQVNSALSGHWAARSYTQLGGSVAMGKHTDYAKLQGAAMGASGPPYPNPVDNGLYMAPVYLHEINAIRGVLPGAWAPLHLRPLNHLDTFEGAGALAGRKFLVFNMYSNAQIFLEISNTWDQ